MIPLVGFAPDAPPYAPGVVTECSNFIPFAAGFKGAPSAVATSVAALAAACRGAAATSNLSGTRRLFAGTGTALYEQSTTSWTDRSRGAGYTLGSDDRWSFIQFGNSTIAATPSALLQRSTTAAFADISGAPKAKIVEAAQGFVMALNTDTSADGWHCSAYLDDTDWALDVATQCVSGRLVGGSGAITAGRRFGDDIVAYKGGSMFVGRYVGAPEVWRWQQVSTDIGCVGQDAVIDTGAGHIFVGRDNVYIFDGTTPRTLTTEPIRDWLYADMSQAYQGSIILLWDRFYQRVWMFYPSAGGTGTCDRCVVHHVPTGRWGVAHMTVEAVVTYQSPGYTYNDASNGAAIGVSTYDSAPNISLDSPYWTSGASSPAIFNGSHVMATLTGVTSSSYFVTGDMGDDEGYSMCKNFRVRYTQQPTTSTVTGYTMDESGLTPASISSATEGDGRHNMRQTARWHRFKVATTGDYEVTAIRPELVQAGRR